MRWRTAGATRISTRQSWFMQSADRPAWSRIWWSAATVLHGKVDAILLTGGVAHSEYVVSRLQERISFLAPVFVYPGEDELEALALNALGALRGELPIQVYQ